MRGEPVRVVNHFSQIAVTLDVDFPERVGLDRLLNALAVTDFLPKGTPAVVVDVGTAVSRGACAACARSPCLDTAA